MAGFAELVSWLELAGLRGFCWMGCEAACVTELPDRLGKSLSRGGSCLGAAALEVTPQAGMAGGEAGRNGFSGICNAITLFHPSPQTHAILW